MKYLPVTIVLLLLVRCARADESCDPIIVGVPDRATIDTFVAAVREAMASPAVDELAAIVAFPLSVSSRDPQYGQVRTRHVENDAELREYAGAIFAEHFRKRILKSAAGDVICRTGLLGLGNGLLWAKPGEDGRLRIASVNNDEFRWEGMATAEVLRCEMSGHLIVVDRPRARVRFRLWAKGRSRSDKPDLTIDGGEEDVEGTGACAHAVWTFRRAGIKYVVREEGCSDGAGPPDRAGLVSIIRNNEPPNERDCLRR